MGPVAMVLAGIVIGGYDFKELLNNKKVYIATALRLFVIPGVILLILKALRADETLLSIALIAFATPLGMNTIVFPASYGGDTKTGLKLDLYCLYFITLPMVFITGMILKFPFLLVYILMLLVEDGLKSIIGLRYYRSMRWIQSVVEKH